MPNNCIPGTVIPQAGVSVPMFSLLKPMIDAADGLTLAQVSSITGLEYSTIQNWVKRGFVAKTVNKKYYGRHLARILIISILRDSMRIEDVGELLRLVNGDATDERDDLLPEQELYDVMCEVIFKTGGASDESAVRSVVDEVIDGHLALADPNKKKTLRRALFVMIYAYRASDCKREAELYFNQMKGAE